MTRIHRQWKCNQCGFLANSRDRDVLPINWQPVRAELKGKEFQFVVCGECLGYDTPTGFWKHRWVGMKKMLGIYKEK